VNLGLGAGQMRSKRGDTTLIARLLENLNQGDPLAREELLKWSLRRLARLASRMLKEYPPVRRRRETDDVVQGALLRLDKALRKDPPKSVEHFFRLAALQIRRELIDLANRFRHRKSVLECDAFPGSSRGPMKVPDPRVRSSSSCGLYDAMERLKPDERRLFDLLHIAGLSQAEAATLLGVSERTLRRQLREAKMSLHAALHDR